MIPSLVCLAFVLRYRVTPMLIALKRAFDRLSFSRQFLLVSAVILVGGMAVIGTWLGRQIESNAVNRAAAIAAVYVESILAAQLDALPTTDVLDSGTHAALDRVFVEGPLHRKVVRFKLWSADGRILYSSDHEQVGRRFAVEGRLAAAFAGELQARISDLNEPDNRPERERWPQLIEVYVPVHARGGIAVAEFYHSMENVGREIRAAQQRSWLLVAVAAAAIYMLLYGLVRRANDTILNQQRDLRRQLDKLRTALGENECMREQLHEAGTRTTALNEQFLHRVAADLHDGPAQEVAFALLRFDDLTKECSDCMSARDDASRDLRRIRNALRYSLAELRTIASGLGMPGIADLSLADTVRHAVRDFERKSGRTVQVEVDKALAEAPLAVKITVYRLLQESLTNSWRHSHGAAQQVRAWRCDGQALVEVVDQGTGFDVQAAFASGRFGLSFMCERVRLLGGVFEVDSVPGHGTRIHARLPLSLEETAHG